MNSIYNRPETNPENSSELSIVPASRTLPIIGCILLFGPLFGVLGTIIGLMRAFSTLQGGNSDPTELAGNISIALNTTMYGIAVGTIGVILVSLALFRSINRERWFYKSVTIISVLWCIFLFPIGLIIGIYFLVSFSKRKSEFYPELTKSLKNKQTI